MGRWVVLPGTAAERPRRSAAGAFVQVSPAMLVGRGGVEPPTFHFSGGRSYQLSYLPERRSPYRSQFGDSESGPLPFDLHLAPIV